MDYLGKKLDFVTNLSADTKVVDFLLFGEIGRQVDGNLFAHEISMFSQFEEIRIHINSVGGSIIHGNSIIGAMAIARTKGIKITTINRGVADSMAGMILANGDIGSRIAMDFSTALVHEPLVVNQKTGKSIRIDEMADSETKTELLMFKESLLVGLSRNTGKDKNELDKIMSNDTRLDARGLKINGFVDSIELSDNKPAITNSMTAVELMAACSNYNKQKNNKMNLVTELLNLNEDASETSIVASIKDLKNKTERVNELETEISNLKEDIESKSLEMAEVESLLKESQEKEVENIVYSAIKEGKFSEDNKEKLVLNAKRDIEMFKALVENMKPSHVDVVNMINKKEDSLNDKELRLAVEYNNADINGTLLDFKNKVGDEKYEKYETAYVNRMNEL